MYYNLCTWGIWYSGPLFQRNGWQVPTTWDAFLALCDRIKKAGVAPFTHAGKHPEYLLEPLLTTAAKTGGLEVLVNIDNLEDGAWLAGPVRQAAAAWQEIGARYLLQGTEGINHTESQGKQNTGEVAMLPVLHTRHGQRCHSRLRLRHRCAQRFRCRLRGRRGRGRHPQSNHRTVC